MLASNIGTGLVVGQFVLPVVDGPDLDQEPELVPLSGTVTFTPTITQLPVMSSTQNPFTIAMAPIRAVLDEEGYVCTPAADGVTPQYRGIRLIATDAAEGLSKNWNYSVAYRFNIVNGATPGVKAHPMGLLTGGERDLTMDVEVPSSPPVGTPQALALLAQAEQAANTSAGYAAVAMQVKADADAGVFDGQPGPAGPNTIPTAEFVADEIGNPASPVATALNAAIGTQTEPLIAPLAAAVARVSASPQMLPLTRALDAGESAGVWFAGDSTGDSDGTSAAADRTASRFARRLADAYPTHHVLFKSWDSPAERFTTWKVMRAHASGRRYAEFNGVRSLRYMPRSYAAEQFTTGAIDVRALIMPDQLSPAAPQTIITRMRKGGAQGPWSNDLQFDFRWYTGGKLAIRHSQDGAAFLSDRISAVAVPFVAGTPLWVRATLEIVPGSGFTAKFYTSPADDGVIWTQLGTDATGGGATTAALYTPAASSFFEVGANGWQPAANGFDGKIYEVGIRDGVDGHTIAPSAIEVWERYADTNTTYGGAPTLYFLNASRSGSAMSYHTDPIRLKKETPNYGQTTLIFNDGHNEVGATGSAWIPPYEAWVTAVQARTPDTAVNVIGQNPHTSAWPNELGYGAEHKKRIMELSATAPRKGWGFINVYQAFLDDPQGLGVLVSPDGLHPTQDGYALAGDTVAHAAGISA